MNSQRMAPRPLVRGAVFAIAAAVLMWTAAARAAGQDATEHWYKGNIHCHSLYSDGNSFPECVVEWYKSRGYNFLALTDHNVFQEGQRWVEIAPPTETKPKHGFASQEALDRYKALFGTQWVDEETSGGKRLARLKTYAEFSPRFETPGSFLLMPGEEITCPTPQNTDYRVHVVATNIVDPIEAPAAAAGQTDPGVWQANSAAKLVASQSKAAGVEMHAHLNHPGWSHLTAADVCRIDGLNQMEINNDDSGSSVSLPATEATWDTVLADRIARGKPLMLGVAVDDAHNHLTDSAFGAGHGWLMVRAASLTAENIIRAIDRGDFYATTGVELAGLRTGRAELALRIRPEAGVTYRTEFVGQRKGGQTGQVLAIVDGTDAIYQVIGNELYVRARVTSSKARMTSRGTIAYYEMAWTQPYQPAKIEEGK
ncbi:MAG: hypothetical protein M1457_10380 [bacterium]|nr:hypothetical protein [bacterium]